MIHPKVQSLKLGFGVRLGKICKKIYITLDFSHRLLIERDPHDNSKEVCFLLEDGWGFELCAEYVDAEDDLFEAGAWAQLLFFYAY